ncbi:CDGSH iron-sulfur domain-containing protein 2 homolog [Halyomorpha halys]|uniref:CDGSH iron-sulfur domain-containing protein 2 homolog n=1 Tax=Halyomorpha halys TaxID=286706 RepID=UPI0006D4DBBE|nr:CDGSH iron-sulfur domain-containing protein 2 homolog [Halyomorpha halys]
MEPVSILIKSSIPNYLSNLPIPDSIGGWFKLGFKDWARLVPFFAAVGGVSYVTYRTIKPKQAINPSIRKDEPKVVDIANIEDLGEKTSYCRCWKSEKFPYCDGAHGKHNRETGDNVGPVVIKRNSSK